MDKHAEMIWQRGNTREIMREARRRFRDTRNTDPVSAYVALASAHYSLVKRYTGSWWQKPLAVWHFFLAAFHAGYIAGIATRVDVGRKGLTADQVDIVTTILAKTPKRLGGDVRTAELLIHAKLFLDRDIEEVMKPHTRALMLITLGSIKLGKGDRERAAELYANALEAAPAILDENQKVRVLTAVGFFWHDNSGFAPGLFAGGYLVREALLLATSIRATDQVEKIKSECRKRSLEITI